MEKWSVKTITRELQKHKNPANVKGMARFGINPKNTLGINIPTLRLLAKTIGKNHALAVDLWKTGIHEARIVACLIDDPAEVTEAQMDAWICDFDSWDVCDLVCMNLFDKTPNAFTKAKTWTSHNYSPLLRHFTKKSQNSSEFVRRAGFALMAALAVHDKKATDGDFVQFFPLIEKYADDDRNFVKKAVNWALRQIGKRNQALLSQAIAVSVKLKQSTHASARWIGSDAFRELTKKEVRFTMHEVR